MQKFAPNASKLEKLKKLSNHTRIFEWQILNRLKNKPAKIIVKRERNLARRTAIKTAVKKVLVSLEKNESLEAIQGLLKDAESKLARAKGKDVFIAIPRNAK